MFDVNTVPVYIFSNEERTTDLCIYSYEKLGFTSINLISGKDSFREKYIRFAKHAVDSEFDYFIRTDADLIVFDGIYDTLKICKPGKDRWIEGKYFDYFMNRRRGGTPHIIPKKAVEVLSANPGLMLESKKPETGFGKYLRDNKLVSFKSVDALTSLHEFEQYPSKVCNSFLNRLKRGHMHLYDFKYINANIPSCYVNALSLAFEVFKSKDFDHADSMKYLDFSSLDIGFEKIDEKDIPHTYNELKKIYLSV